MKDLSVVTETGMERPRKVHFAYDKPDCFLLKKRPNFDVKNYHFTTVCDQISLDEIRRAHMNLEKLMEHISIISDYRQSWKVEHKLSDILLLTICVVISGAEGWEDIEDFGHV